MDMLAHGRYNGARSHALGNRGGPMHKIVPVLTLFLMILLVRPGWPAPQAPAARELVDKAIKAHGGADNLAKTRYMVRSVKGEIAAFGAGVAFTGEDSLNLP